MDVFHRYNFTVVVVMILFGIKFHKVGAKTLITSGITINDTIGSINEEIIDPPRGRDLKIDKLKTGTNFSILHFSFISLSLPKCQFRR